MSKEMKGKVKEKVWVRPICTDDSEPLRLGRKARKDFKKHARQEGPVDVAAPDVVGEAQELGDELTDPTD